MWQSRCLRRACLLMNFMILGGTSYAAEPSREPSPGDMVFRIETAKQKFSLFEPVVVTYTLKNASDSLIKTHAMMGYDEHHLKLFIQAEDRQPAPWYSGPIADFVGQEDTIHGPGQSMTESVVIFYNDLSKSVAFPKLGRYKISGKMYLGNFPKSIFAESDPVQIEVVEPSVVDRKVVEILGSEEALIELLKNGPGQYCRNNSSPRCFEELRLLSKQFPESGYVPPITFFLATSIGWEGAGVTAQYSLETDILRDFLSHWPDHPLAPSVTGTLAYAFHKSGKEREAMEWVDRFEQKYPSRSSPRHLIAQSSGSR